MVRMVYRVPIFFLASAIRKGRIIISEEFANSRIYFFIHGVAYVEKAV